MPIITMTLRNLPPRHQRGLSIVELMVGVAIGLFVVAAAAMVVSTQLADNRRLLLETQLQQDLRATADIVTRELRRAGYWQEPLKAISIAGAAPSASNPYSSITSTPNGPEMAASAVASEVLLSYSSPAAAENNVVDSAEQLGFRLDNGVVQTQLGSNNWQALTDANTMTVTAFTLTMDIQRNTLSCPKACGALTNCPPTQDVRSMLLNITAQAKHDPAVQRSLRSKVRLRNDVVTGACPA